MNVCTDSIRFADQWFSPPPHWKSGLKDQMTGESWQIAKLLLSRIPPAIASIDLPGPWQHLVMVEHAPHSQFDTLVKAMRAGAPLPHGLVCLTGSGEGFHGQWGRLWKASPGNIHLCIFLSPGGHLNELGAGLTILPAVSLVQMLDSIPGLEMRAGIRWVNDILIDESKVAGFLVHTQSSDGNVTGAVIGIGLNVETVPRVAPTVFVPSVTSLHHHLSDPRTCSRSVILHRLLSVIARNYEKLIKGHSAELLRFYRERSLILGRDVVVYKDSQDAKDHERKPIAEGKVLTIGDRLELILAGERRPVFGGRIVIKRRGQSEGVKNALT